MAPTPADDDRQAIACHLDVLLEQRSMTLKELSGRVGVTVVSRSVLKNDPARAVRFPTLAALCDALDCQPGELFSYLPGTDGRRQEPPAPGEHADIVPHVRIRRATSAEGGAPFADIAR